MTLRPDLEMYETDGNLEPIRHPEAQHALAMMAKYKERQERLMALWRAAWEYKISRDDDSFLRVFDAQMGVLTCVNALGPPPDAAPDKP